MVDVIIIGSGVIGSSIARELSKFNANILVLEKENDVSVGASKANSGIVHGGFDAMPNTLKAHFNILGNSMFENLSKELDFPYKKNGSIVLCFDENEREKLEELLYRGIENGVKEMYIANGDEIRKIEPFVAENVVAGLVVPNAGIVSPYEMTIAFAENACQNGVKFRFNSSVCEIQKEGDIFLIKCEDGFCEKTRAVINCAGVFADEINNMICEKKYKIIPRKGDYELFDNSCEYIASHTLFQLPTKMGKGVLVTPTVHGNILIGPTANDLLSKDNKNTTSKELADVISKASLTIPNLPLKNIITQFSGIRAHLDSGDFIIEESNVSGFFNCLGIESPGLSCAPAIAVYVSNMVATKFNFSKKNNFIKNRKGIPHFAKLSNEERKKLIEENPLYGKIVCRCEMVTEGEIVNSINRPLGATDIDGIKRRTRAGMGRCQAGFCTPKVIEILARELKNSIENITKFGNQSYIVKGRTK